MAGANGSIIMHDDDALRIVAFSELDETNGVARQPTLSTATATARTLPDATAARYDTIRPHDTAEGSPRAATRRDLVPCEPVAVAPRSSTL